MSALRIHIVGVSGSGKSSLAETLATRFGLPRLELDAVFWDAGWTYRDLDEAHGIVRSFLEENPGGWVIDGNWTSKLDGLLDPDSAGGPDVIVWLDHSRARVMSRVVRRTLRRSILREELWHGNRERPSSWLRLDPEQNIMRWAWVQHPLVRRRMPERAAQGWPIVRLSGQRAVDAWVSSLADGPGAVG